MEPSWDVIVIGAGAAGLLAATRAAERGRRTLLLEKNDRPGVKILMSGGTRCNLTHATDARGIVAAFGKQGPFLHSALAALGPETVVDYVAAEGVATQVEAGGKIFPRSGRASDIVDALVARLRRSGAELALEEPVLELSPAPTANSAPGNTINWLVRTPRRALHTSAVIVTTGGKSYPGSGTTGDAYRWLTELGHRIVPPRPALTPVTTHETWVRELSGLTCADVLVRVLPAPAAEASPAILPATSPPGGKPAHTAPAKLLAQRRGSLLFTHFGLSGPAVLDVSREISGHGSPSSLLLTIDLLPDESLDQLDQRLRAAAAADGRRLVITLLAEFVAQRLAQRVAELAGMDASLRAAELTKVQRRTAAELLKRLPVRVAGTMGFRKAEVTAGGVPLDEVDSRNMQSRRAPGLYLAGEVLDLDGPIGGYNFQAAFSTGYLAGDRA